MATPMSKPTTTATGRFRNLAASTAANDDAISTTVNCVGSRPISGAARTPARPAKKVLTAHTPMEMAAGLDPDRSVMAGESTMARTLRPTSV